VCVGRQPRRQPVAHAGPRVGGTVGLRDELVHPIVRVPEVDQEDVEVNDLLDTRRRHLDFVDVGPQRRRECRRRGEH
jgi:hypothetical protein